MVHAPTSLAELLTERLEAPSQVPGALFPLRRGEVGLLFGPPGAGKTFVGLECAVGCASEGETALVVAGEGGRRSLRDRLIAVAAGRLATVAPRLHLAATTSLTEVELLRWVDARRPGLVVIDPVAAFLAGDENAAGDVTDFLGVARAIANAGAAVLLIHHSAKGRRRDPRGSGAFVAGVDVAVSITRQRDSTARLASIKVRDAEPFEFAATCRFEPDRVVIRTETARAPLHERLVALVESAGAAGIAKTDARRQLRVSGATLARLVGECEGRIEERRAAPGRRLVLCRKE